MKFVSAILTTLAASASVGHARISSKEDKGYDEGGHRSIKQEAMSMSMPNTTIVMLSEEIELDDFESTIVGGGVATPGERPYLVSLGNSVGCAGVGGHCCGGSLITPNVILTAAHCILDPVGNPNPVQWVDFRRQDLRNHEPGAIRMSVGAAHQIHHQNYNPVTKDLDVALIFLPMAVSGITPVTLNENSKVPSTAKSAATGVPLDIAGWGLTEMQDFPWNGVHSPVLRETTVNYITNKQCTSPPNLYLKSQITNNMMCVSHAAGTGECQNDSGGPLVLSTGIGPATPVVQVGVVSWSDKTQGCAGPNYPGVYVRVSAVAGWIKRTVCARTGELCKTNTSSKARKLAH